jgi:hypothetical protein
VVGSKAEIVKRGEFFEIQARWFDFISSRHQVKIVSGPNDTQD